MSDGSTLYIQVVILNVATTCYATAFMYMLVDFYYNRSAVKKIKKSSSFKDKLLFSKYGKNTDAVLHLLLCGFNCKYRTSNCVYGI